MAIGIKDPLHVQPIPCITSFTCESERTRDLREQRWLKSWKTRVCSVCLCCEKMWPKLILLPSATGSRQFLLLPHRLDSVNILEPDHAVLGITFSLFYRRQTLALRTNFEETTREFTSFYRHPRRDICCSWFFLFLTCTTNSRCWISVIKWLNLEWKLGQGICIKMI